MYCVMLSPSTKHPNKYICIHLVSGIEQELKLKRDDDDDLEVAMGTFMTYGGKILRQIGLWAYNGTATVSSDNTSAIEDKNTGIPS